MYNAFNKLGLLTDVIYDKDRHEFQFLHIGDQSGTRPIKLTKGLFKLIIRMKTYGVEPSI